MEYGDQDSYRFTLSWANPTGSRSTCHQCTRASEHGVHCAPSSRRDGTQSASTGNRDHGKLDHHRQSRCSAYPAADQALGVSIAIDDFGTGYSSLETLRAFPFDKIKLDRSFMNDVETSQQAKAIIRAILALGRSLEVPVLAEGVETLDQLEILKKQRLRRAQGYLLGKPGPIGNVAGRE